VLTVNVEVPPDNGLNEQVGAGVPPPVMLLQARLTVPEKPLVGVIVIVEVAEPPGETVAGESAVAVIVKPAPPPLPTISVTGVVLVCPPPVPLTVTCDVPVGVLAVVVILRVAFVLEPSVTDAGENAQVAPAGSPAEQVRLTVPVKPDSGAIVSA
jgi:hypothetical protein